MKRLHDYLDYDIIRVKTKDGNSVTGRPISVLYADESPSGKDELNVENTEGIAGFTEKEIENVEIVR